MKTPIQELICHIAENGIKKYPLVTLQLIEKLAVKEKKIIKETLVDGLSDVDFPKDLEAYAENYFNETFNYQ